jgi:hypothetical protein
MAQIDTSPPSLDVGSLETYPLAVDATAYVPSGGSTSSAAATLVELNSGTDRTSTGISGTPSLSGNVLTVTIHALTAGKTYSLFVLFTFSDSSELETRTIIRCPA